MNNREPVIPVVQDFEPFCKGCPYICTAEVMKYADEVLVCLTITCNKLDTCRRAYELGCSSREAAK